MTATFAERLEAVRALLSAPDPGRPPGWLLDQHRAARLDAWNRLLAPTAQLLRSTRTIAGEGFVPDGPEALEVEAHLLAGAADCTPCPHIRVARGPQPILVALPLHQAMCLRCAGTVRNPPADEDDRCDLCGSRGHAEFVPIVAQAGHIVIAGDVGPCCARLTEVVNA